MKANVLLAIVALSYAPVAAGGNEAAYPTERVAEFVVAKLDVNSLPSVFRPKKDKGKRTFQTTDSHHKSLMKAKSWSRHQVPRGGWPSRFSIVNPQESMYALLRRDKTEVNQKRKLLFSSKEKIRMRC